MPTYVIENYKLVVVIFDLALIDVGIKSLIETHAHHLDYALKQGWSGSYISDYLSRNCKTMLKNNPTDSTALAAACLYGMAIEFALRNGWSGSFIKDLAVQGTQEILGSVRSPAAMDFCSKLFRLIIDHAQKNGWSGSYIKELSVTMTNLLTSLR
jgi:hypothetical protein